MGLLTQARDEPVIFRARRSLQRKVRLGTTNITARHEGLLTPEERERITELQYLLIDRFVEHRDATAQRQEERVKILEAEIDDLLRKRAEVEKWATVGSA